MNTASVLFYFFMCLAAVTAGGILFSKNVFKSALLLLVSLLSLSAIYVLSFAEFVAITQILIYAGGILVVIIFGIMLTTKISGRPLVVNNGNIFSGALAGILTLWLLVRYLSAIPSSGPQAHVAENISVIAVRIFIDYSLPFEIAGLLLLVALVGAAVITSHLKSRV